MRETQMVIRDFGKEKLQPGEIYNHKEASSLFQDLEEEVRILVDKVGVVCMRVCMCVWMCVRACAGAGACA